MVRISLVTTVLNEEKTIDGFLDSVVAQTLKPDEVIIVDGGSMDRTVEKIKKEKLKIKNDNLKLEIIEGEGLNRSQGRNLGVKNAKGEIIAFTDAGCILDKDWLAEIIKPFVDPKIEVVAGYYRGMAKTVFEKCVVPYVLVMPDKVNPNNFYPASRSMAIRKGTFWKVGGFPEEFSDNEDYVFAHKLAKNGIKAFFCKKAIVNWLPRSNLKSFWTMIYRFARGDARAGLRRLKVATIFARYLIFTLTPLAIFFKYFSPLLYCYIVILLFYPCWSIFKNYRYVRGLKALFLLPVLQITSDLAVMTGTIAGRRIRWKRILLSQ